MLCSNQWNKSLMVDFRGCSCDPCHCQLLLTGYCIHLWFVNFTRTYLLNQDWREQQLTGFKIAIEYSIEPDNSKLYQPEVLLFSFFVSFVSSSYLAFMFICGCWTIVDLVDIDFSCDELWNLFSVSFTHF